MTLQTGFVDDLSMAGKIFHNGRILRDGKTIFNTELKAVTFFRNGKHIRDGLAFRATIYRRFPAADMISLPLTHGDSGMRDRFSLAIGLFPFEDRHFAQAFRNGSNHRNGSINRNGFSDKSVNERFDPLCIGIPVTEEVETSEQSNVAVRYALSDTLPSNLKHNGLIERNGITKRNNGLVENQRMNITMNEFADTAYGTLYRNRSIQRTSAEFHRIRGIRLAYDTLRMWYRKHHFHNGVYFRNNNIKRDGMILIPLE
jgi:hypothetical protein